MIERRDEISLLLSRLIHPSGMVREKTCTVFAGLLVHPETRRGALEGLQSWTEVQVLETVVISTLLIHIRAQMIDPSYEFPEAPDLLRRFPRPSLLSWMLAIELYRSEIEAPNWEDLSSGDPPPAFETEQFFEKYAASLVGEMLLRQAQAINKTTGFPFTRQWEWERSLLVKSTSLRIRDRVFWQRGDSESKWYASYYFRLTDILLSAFLRALAHYVEKKAISLKSAMDHAALCSPIDLGLWKVEPEAPPLWWPKLAVQRDILDTSGGEVIRALESAWQDFADDKSEWLPVQANGFVGGDSTKIFLEIYGLFQWCLGPRQPDIGEIARWCRGIVSETFFPKSPLNISGKLLPSSLHRGNCERQFGHWMVAPAFAIIPFSSGINWQWWRYYRKIWGPASFLVDSPLMIEATTARMVFKDQVQEVALWFDWNDCLQEMVDANLPPLTGQCLVVRRKYIEKIGAPVKPNFCWIWSITLFDRPYETGRYKMICYDGQLGASLVIRV